MKERLEPGIAVRLDPKENALLDAVVSRTGLKRSEVVRRALRLLFREIRTANNFQVLFRQVELTPSEASLTETADLSLRVAEDQPAGYPQKAVEKRAGKK